MDKTEERQEAPNPDFVQGLYLEKEFSDWEKQIISCKVKLEKLQDELTQTEDILEKAEKMKGELLEEIALLVEQKCNLEKQCDDLSAERGKRDEHLRLKIKELQGKEAELKEAEIQLKLIRLKRDRNYVPKKRESALLIALGVSLAVIFCGWIYLNGKGISKWGTISKLGDTGEYAGAAIVKVDNLNDPDEKYSKA